MAHTRPKVKVERPAINEESCRICLQQCTHKDQDSRRFSNPYKMCTGYEIKVDDIPKKICGVCIVELKQSLTFRNKCSQTEDQLFSFMLEGPTEVSEEVDEVIAEMQVPLKKELTEDEVPMKEEMEEFFLHDEEEGEEDDEMTDSAAMVEIEVEEGDDEETTTMESYFMESYVEDDAETYEEEEEEPTRVVVNYPRTSSKKSNTPPSRKQLKNPDDSLQCTVCLENGDERSFTTRKLLLQHTKRMHSAEKRVRKCPHCDREFTSDNTYQCHIYRQHTDPKDYKYECQLCHKRYFQLHLLKIHQQVHTGEKNHKCGECGAMFRFPQGLRIHMENIHNPQSIDCEVCGKAFGNQKYLNQHMKMHAPGQYQCPLCKDLRFSHPTTLRLHIKKCHKGFPLPPAGTKLKNFDWDKNISGIVLSSVKSSDTPNEDAEEDDEEADVSI